MTKHIKRHYVAVEDISETTIAWLAGLLEGEGCFPLTDSPQIIVKMTDKDVVETIAKIFQVSVYTIKSRKPGVWKDQYRAWIKGADACVWMRLISPYMHGRRQARILEVLDKHELTYIGKKLLK